MRLVYLFAVAALSFALGLGPVFAQELQTAAEDTPQTLVVATREVPPFAFRDDAGNWAGLSIELWRDIAANLGITYRFEETTLEEMLDGVAGGRYDAAVAALTVTAEREESVDFSHPFFSTGLAIATRPDAGGTWAALSGLITWRAALVVFCVVVALILVGALLWVSERRHNKEYFGDKASEGIFGGIWLSLAMFVTGEYADQVPRSLAGRVLSTMWVVSSLIVLTIFTGIVTSALTVQKIEGRVQGLNDLPRMVVGTLPASTSEVWLNRARIAYVSFSTIEEGLVSLAQGRIDAFVYDAPTLKYVVLNEFADRVIVLPDAFAPQDYAIALPAGNEMRESINRELLAIKRSDVWAQRVFQYIGDR